MLALKRETAKLRSDLERKVDGGSRPETEMDGGSGDTSRRGGAIGVGTTGRLAPLLPASSLPALGKQEVEQRHQDIIKRLKRLLEIERRNVRTVRTAHINELANRTELEAFLRQCIDDVKSEITRRRGEMFASMNRAKGGAGSMSAEDGIALGGFSAADRERVMELLLSQERVINLLYDKTFPRRVDSKGAQLGGLPQLEQIDDMDAQMELADEGADGADENF